MNNIIFIVTSVVNVKNLSVYTPEERYSQTKITIQNFKPQINKTNKLIPICIDCYNKK
jgi:hypothetical protein